MAAIGVKFESIEEKVQAHMALHPNDDIFQVRSAFAMSAMLNEAPAAVVKPTPSGGRILDLPLVRGALSLLTKNTN